MSKQKITGKPKQAAKKKPAKKKPAKDITIVQPSLKEANKRLERLKKVQHEISWGTPAYGITEDLIGEQLLIIRGIKRGTTVITDQEGIMYDDDDEEYDYDGY